MEPTDITEVRCFMVICMFISTMKLPSPRKYWTERIPQVVNNFSVKRFEQLRSSIHFASEIGSANSMEESRLKVKPLINLINDRLA